MICTIIIATKKTKRAEKIVLSKNDLTIYIYNNHLKISEKFCYNYNDVELDFKSRKQPNRGILRNNTYELCIEYLNKKYKYLLHIDNEPSFFAFILYKELFINNLNIKELTDEQLYTMYHTKKYGLK